jgi:hypothetical protein
MEAVATAQDDSASSTPDSTTPDAGDTTPAPDVATPSEPSDTPAATQPSDTGAAPEKKRGPLPYERHEAILANQRKEYEWVQQYGDVNTIRQKLDILARAEQDPATFARTFVAAANLNPQELFALQQQAQQAAAPVPERPAPDVLLENGQSVYSDTQLAKLLEWQQSALLSRINQDIAPIKQRAAMAEMSEQATVKAKQQLAAAQTWPGLREHKADLAAYLRANPHANLADAYIAVVPAKLADQAAKATQQGHQQALSELQSKAGAASPPAPRTAGSAPALDTSQMTMREAIEAAAKGLI